LGLGGLGPGMFLHGPVGVNSELIGSLEVYTSVVGPETTLPELGLPWNTVVVVVVVVTSKVSVNVPAWTPCRPEFPTSHGWVVFVVWVSVVTTVSSQVLVVCPFSGTFFWSVHVGWADAPTALKASTAAMTAAKVSSNPMRLFIVSCPLFCFRSLLLLSLPRVCADSPPCFQDAIKQARRWVKHSSLSHGCVLYEVAPAPPPLPEGGAS
jgi:hypothetical protein